MDLNLAACTEPATVAVEVYSPRQSLHGSLDATVYVCAEHEGAAIEAVGAAKLTPFVRHERDARGRACGYTFDYTQLRRTQEA